jgi:hypothetical protein
MSLKSYHVQNVTFQAQRLSHLRNSHNSHDVLTKWKWTVKHRVTSEPMTFITNVLKIYCSHSCNLDAVCREVRETVTGSETAEPLLTPSTTDIYDVFGSYGPPLWCSGQSSWLQIQMSGVRVRIPALPDFLRSTGSGTGSTTQPREYD